jgi:hypothetical protein
VFKKTNIVEPTPLEEEKLRVLTLMSALAPDSMEYTNMAAQFEVLTNCTPEKVDKSVNINTVLTVFGNLLGILLVTGYEHAHVITSKGLSFVMKPK